MIDQLAALIVDESKWLTASMGLALLATARLYYRRHSAIPNRSLVLAAMNLFFGITIGSMAFGHLLAVTTKLLLGTLDGSPPIFYTIGMLLAAPSWWVIYHTRALLASPNDQARKTLMLNVWLAGTLLVLGLPNLPLAMPGFLNIGYQLHRRAAVGRIIVAAAVVINGGLFIGSLIFLASGQSFEQFRGMQ